MMHRLLRTSAPALGPLLLVSTLHAVDRPDPFPAYYPSAGDKSEAETALQLALEALSEGQLEQAAEGATIARQLTPTAASPRVILGMVAEQKDRRADAVDEYREALAWSPDESRALAALERLDAPRYGDVISQFEDQLVDLANQARERAGVPSLKPHPALRDVARRHSAAMRDLGFFGHVSPKAGHTTAADRFLKRFEGPPKRLGENISRRWLRPQRALNSQNILRSHAELLASPRHRANMLHPDFVYVAVGIAVNPAGDYWITQLFMTPRAQKATGRAEGRQR